MAPSTTTELKNSSADSCDSKHKLSLQQKRLSFTTPSAPSEVSVANITAATVTPNSTQNPVRVDLAGDEENASVSAKDSLLRMDKLKEPLLDVSIDPKLTDPRKMRMRQVVT
mmetsp:Transcript_42303/g.47781  ORF Transcript_42303/g.47781 Transcript_42303/m.47781 type:complete len:112 (-) Transcript_42303:492-827(-)